MRQLKYVNSQGQEIDFRKFDTQIYQAGFHTYAWTYEGTAQRFGTTVDRFGKDALEYEMVVAVRGNQKIKESNLNLITEVTEIDVINGVQGRLYWGDYYLNCNIISATSAPSETFFGVEKTMGVFAPFPFWIKEETHQFFAAGSGRGSAAQFLDYPYDYAYDYTPPISGVENWYVDHYAGSDFIMTIFGACENPRILINGWAYEVFDTLESGEHIIIDSRNNPVPSVTKYRTNGTTVNLWSKRGLEQSIFEPIPSGNLTVNWSGNFGFNITLFLQRSEPAW